MNNKTILVYFQNRLIVFHTVTLRILISIDYSKKQANGIGQMLGDKTIFTTQFDVVTNVMSMQYSNRHVFIYNTNSAKQHYILDLDVYTRRYCSNGLIIVQAAGTLMDLVGPISESYTYGSFSAKGILSNNAVWKKGRSILNSIEVENNLEVHNEYKSKSSKKQENEILWRISRKKEPQREKF